MPIKVHEDFDVYVGRELRWAHAKVVEDDQFSTVTVRAVDPNDQSVCPKVLILTNAVLLTSSAYDMTWDGTTSDGPVRLSARGNVIVCCGRR